MTCIVASSEWLRSSEEQNHRTKERHEEAWVQVRASLISWLSDMALRECQTKSAQSTYNLTILQKKIPGRVPLQSLRVMLKLRVWGGFFSSVVQTSFVATQFY